METITASLRGMYRDILRDARNSVVYDSGWRANTIVDHCRILLAGFMKNESSSGIQFLAVGQGSEDWDSKLLQPDTTTTDLVKRYDQPIPVNLVYLDEKEQVVGTPTQRLQITATLERGCPPPLASSNTYPLREFGLFGRFKGNDYMINYVRHAVIHKDNQTSLERIIKLYF